MSESTGKSKSRSHGRKAADEFQKAAEAFAEHAVPPEALAHLREAARHLLRAGLSALDEADRRSRERSQKNA